MPPESTSRSARPSGAEAPPGAPDIPDPVQAAAEMQAQALRALTGMNTAWVERLSDMGSEVMTFVAHRIAQDVRTQHALLHCRDAKELQKIQAEFLQAAVNDYANETGKLMDMSKRLFEPETEDGAKDA